LRYYSFEEIEQSKALTYLVAIKWLEVDTTEESEEASATTETTNNYINEVVENTVIEVVNKYIDESVGGSNKCKEWKVVTAQKDYEAEVWDVVLCDPKKGEGITITLPLASKSKDEMIIVKRIEKEPKEEITIRGFEKDLIDEQEKIALKNKFSSVMLVSDGKNWYIVAEKI
jgi:hypothetical protein